MFNTFLTVGLTAQRGRTFQSSTQKSSRTQVTLTLIKIVGLRLHILFPPDLVSVHYRPGSGLPIPQMEQLSLPGLQVGSSLVREVRRGRPQAQSGDQEVVTPRTDGQVVFLAPGPSLGAASSRKRHAHKQNENSLPVEVSQVMKTGVVFTHFQFRRDFRFCPPPPQGPRVPQGQAR